MSTKTASHMRHPVDSPTWNKFDTLHPGFAQESRNVRLGLASDGINPFKNMTVSHNTWPVILFPYNFPPWMCMKEPYLILKHGGKYCYMGHQRFLPKENEFRKNRRLFDGTVEYGEAPQRQSGNMVMEELKEFTIKFGKQVKDNPKPFGSKRKEYVI
ncbi:hypothetical protein SASPL_126943 [Salvia splendens]|uniref:Uncharacterized protein n=1 Tax=Salvia splendens TaxID=180675 RepID=A0A8X8XGL0_SALSN|nr:hypothetical protein SASPL_126943 [Salvia splendens]